VAFAFRESSAPAARADAIRGSRSAESKTPSQWNDGSMEAATAALGELPHAALMLGFMIQSHHCANQCPSLNRVIKVLSSCFGTGNAITSIAIHVLSNREGDRIPRGALPSERDSRCLIIRGDG
jgi:hypothetical protein